MTEKKKKNSFKNQLEQEFKEKSKLQLKNKKS